MKRLIWLIPLFLCSYAGATACTGTISAPLVQCVNVQGSSGGGGTLAVTVASTGAGNTLFVFYRFVSGVASVTDNKSNTWTCNGITGQSALAVCYATGSTVAGVTTVTLAGPAFTNFVCNFLEFTPASSSLDIANAAWTATVGPANVVSSSITTTATDTLIGIAQIASGKTNAACGSYTVATDYADTGGSGTDLLVEYQGSVTAGSGKGACFTTNDTGIDQSALFAFKGAGGVKRLRGAVISR